MEAVGAIRSAPTTAADSGIRARLDGFGDAALVAALTVYTAFNAGGYFADTFALVAVALLLLLALRVAVVPRPFAGWGPRLLIPGAAVGLFASWSLLSVAWSDDAGRTILEACRVLPYLLTLLTFAASVWSPLRLRRAAAGIAAATIIVAVAALASRLFPDRFHTSTNIQPERLSFPITYWNALALLAGFGLVICMAFASDRTAVRGVRAATAAAIPALAVTVLLTYSRGGVVIVALMLALYLVIDRPAGAVTAVISTTAPTAVALVVAYRADQLASADPTTAAAAAQGHRVAAVLAACTLAAGALQLVLVARGEGRLALPSALRKRLKSRRVRWVLMIALAAALLVPLVRATARQVDRFSAPPAAASLADTRNRLSDPSSNGRVQYWDAALDEFRSAPVHGTGAGTYQLAWWRYRSVPQTVTEAHSLYLQALGETGIVGLTLLLAALVPLLAALIRRLRGSERSVIAALVACAAGWLIHSGLDWDWQVAAVTLWLFAVGGIAVAREPGEAAARRPLSVLSRAGIGVGLIMAAGLPALVAISQSKLDGALDAYTRSDCPAAVDAARSARAALPARAEPRMVLGWCASRGGHVPDAITELRDAVDRAGGDWETHYGLAVVLAASGRDPRSEIAAAQRLNPLERSARQAASEFATAGPRAWKRPALGASLFLNGLPYPPLGG